MNSARSHDPRPGADDSSDVSAPIFNAPKIVLSLAAFLLVSHLLFLFLPAAAKFWISWNGAVSPARFVQPMTSPASGLQKLSSLVTHMVLHANWLHVGLNTVWLMAFGAPVARRLGADRPQGDPNLARAQFLFVLFFIVCGVVGALTYIVLHPSDPTPMIGASGGVSGLLGGLVRFAFKRPGSPPWQIASLFDRNVLVWTVVIIVMNLLVGLFGDGLTGDGSSIAWESHIGGYLFGLLTFPAVLGFARRG